MKKRLPRKLDLSRETLRRASRRLTGFSWVFRERFPQARRRSPFSFRRLPGVAGRFPAARRRLPDSGGPFP